MENIYDYSLQKRAFPQYIFKNISNTEILFIKWKPVSLNWRIKHTKPLTVNNMELQHLKCFPENSTINLIVNLAFSKCLFELIWYFREFMTDICLCLGCWNKTPRLSSFKTTEIRFSLLWSLDGLKARHQHGYVLVRTPAGSQPVPSCSVFTW